MNILEDNDGSAPVGGLHVLIVYCFAQSIVFVITVVRLSHISFDKMTSYIIHNEFISINSEQQQTLVSVRYQFVKLSISCKVGFKDRRLFWSYLVVSRWRTEIDLTMGHWDDFFIYAVMIWPSRQFYF